VVAGTLSVTVKTVEGEPLQGAVVTASPSDDGRRAPPAREVIDQRNRAFVPGTLVIPVGSTVNFPNSDSVSHQIYSFSPAKRFQLPLYRGAAHPPVRFDQPGLVTLGCNIHDSMVAYIVVTDAAFFGSTDEAGTWSAHNLPAARVHVKIWHPRLRDDPESLARDVSLSATGQAQLTVTLTKALRPAPLQGRLHAWDDY
jgi:plastocyanin